MPSTETCYPSAAPGAPYDGRIGFFNAGGDTWAELMARTTGTTHSASDTTMACNLQADGNVNEFDAANKIFIGFDLSAIPAGATIAAAEIQAYPTAKFDTFTQPGSISLVSASPAVESGTSVDHWDDHTTDKMTAADTTIASITLNSLQTIFTLNAAGLSYLEGKIGANAFFCIAPSWIIDGIPPVWNAGGEVAQVTIAARDNADSAKHPRLIVEYTLGGGIPSRVGFDPPPYMD